MDRFVRFIQQKLDANHDSNLIDLLWLCMLYHRESPNQGTDLLLEKVRQEIVLVLEDG